MNFSEDESVKRLKNTLEDHGLEPDKDVVVVGSGVLCVHGIREHRDLDVVVSRATFERLKDDPKLKFSEFKDGAPRLQSKDLDIFIKWDKPGSAEPNFEELFNESELVGGVRVLSLERVVSWKKRWAREKDLADLKLIRKKYA
jgi:hypothetical protein